jgi:hypothetical protein
MKILVIQPGHAYSTADVCDGLVWGLRANGADVYEYPLLGTLQVAEALVGAAKSIYALGPDDDRYPSAFDLAAAGIPGVAMARGVDACIVVTGSNLPYTIPITLRRGGIPTALLCTESPYLTHKRERHDAAVYDLVFTNDRAALPLFDRGPAGRVHYLPHAYHPQRHTPDGSRAEPCDVYFVGTRFPERDALLGGVDWGGVDFRDHSLRYAEAVDRADITAQVTPNADAASHYRAAAISLNHHRTAVDFTSGDYAGPVHSLGPRAYEISACGGFQLCDDARPELDEVFGGTVPTYRAGDSADLEQKIRHYLSIPGTREQLARAQMEAVAPHRWDARARHLLEVLTTFTRGSLFAEPAIPAHTPA